jgi:hypothetical protein
MLQSLEPRAWRRVESPPVEVIIHVTSPVSITRVFRHFARPIKKIVSHDQQVGLDRGASASNFVELPNCADFPQRMRTASETRNEFSSVFLGPFAAPFLVLYHGGRACPFFWLSISPSSEGYSTQRKPEPRRLRIISGPSNAQHLLASRFCTSPGSSHAR